MRKKPLKVLAQTSSGAYLDVLTDHPAENQNLTIVQQPACKIQILQMTQQSFQNLKKRDNEFFKTVYLWIFTTFCCIKISEPRILVLSQKPKGTHPSETKSSIQIIHETQWNKKILTGSESPHRVAEENQKQKQKNSDVRDLHFH